MKFTFNDDTIFDFDRLDAGIQDLLHRFIPFASFSQDTLGKLDDFTLRSMLRRLTARRDTLNDAIDMIQQELTRRQSPPGSEPPATL
ncbi:hypothetical protein [Sulfobacillus thermosulfidooxidans]|uniref:Uncharacterized protein n=2 Tax=Sulfobacillus thermosulfidooxidans TaxID=28034 RepID=A0A1W1WKH9_SULTA|nr:hypothetical protein [Sulfobacillus thermosulfidooxidans]OLZ08746.1 hypothetical protein BFX05_15135 [Sulfobacillus thermosulfidooxidans]OLZ14834.1 hypothetical protein BFX06_05900 [Sulfobacillus thermosulfidooxidans]OLZ22022.1 hypothetical protein BFX07_10470 [Sulfobacillus thermosulfidooxidans]PSR27711.1 MAG: hypothetical protein C7B47_07695 [Sulfobacillus thermosulfidooxidans]SMC06669.1 hypothetical protein SAMN00768000_2948 [Sulfobacillus thermosulfidooxidans DSM 9293]